VENNNYPMLEEAEGGPSYSIEEVDAYMRELLHPKNQIYLTESSSDYLCLGCLSDPHSSSIRRHPR